MVKFVQCVIRKSGMDTVDFRSRWTEYGKRLEALVRERPNVVRYRLTTTLLVKETVTFMVKYGSATPFDGMVELWLDDARITAANLRGADPAMLQAIAELSTSLQEFVDRDRSMSFFAIEEIAFDREFARA